MSTLADNQEALAQNLWHGLDVRAVEPPSILVRIVDTEKGLVGTTAFFRQSADNLRLLYLAEKIRDDHKQKTVDIAVFGNDERMLLVARLDNLGKGASGAAVQAMNVHLGVEESLGLV